MLHVVPSRFRQAAALNNLSVQLAGTGHAGEAMAAVEEAVALYRRRADTDAAVHRQALAPALTNLVVLAEAT